MAALVELQLAPLLVATLAAQRADATDLGDLDGHGDAVDRTRWRYRRARAQARARPQRRDDVEGGSEGVGGLLVVDAPALEVHPGGLRFALELHSPLTGSFRGLDELFAGEGDVVVRAGVGGYGVVEGVGQLTEREVAHAHQ